MLTWACRRNGKLVWSTSPRTKPSVQYPRHPFCLSRVCESSPACGVTQQQPRDFGCGLHPVAAAPKVAAAQNYDGWIPSLCYHVNSEHIGKIRCLLTAVKFLLTLRAP